MICSVGLLHGHRSVVELCVMSWTCYMNWVISQISKWILSTHSIHNSFISTYVLTMFGTDVSQKDFFPCIWITQSSRLLFQESINKNGEWVRLHYHQLKARFTLCDYKYRDGDEFLQHKFRNNISESWIESLKEILRKLFLKSERNPYVVNGSWLPNPPTALCGWCKRRLHWSLVRHIISSVETYSGGGPLVECTFLL